MNIVDTTSYKLHSRLPTGNVSYILLGYLHAFFKGSLKENAWNVSMAPAGYRDGGGRVVRSLGNIIRGLRANDPKHIDINVTLFFGLQAPGHISPCLWYLTCLGFIHDYLFWNRKVIIFSSMRDKKQTTNHLCWTKQHLLLKIHFYRSDPTATSAAVLFFFLFSMFVKVVNSSVERLMVLMKLKARS